MNLEQRIRELERELARLSARVPLREPGNQSGAGVEYSLLPNGAMLTSADVGKVVDYSGALATAPAVAGGTDLYGIRNRYGVIVNVDTDGLLIVWSGPARYTATALTANKTYYLTTTPGVVSSDVPDAADEVFAVPVFYSTEAYAGAPETSSRLSDVIAGANANIVVRGLGTVGVTSLHGYDPNLDTNSTVWASLDAASQGAAPLWHDPQTGRVYRGEYMDTLTKIVNASTGDVSFTNYTDMTTANRAGAIYWDTATFGGAGDYGKVLSYTSNAFGVGKPGWTPVAVSSFSIAWSAITGTPTTLAGYGITDPVVLTSGSYANPTWLTSLAGTKITGTSMTLTTNTSDTTAAAGLVLTGTWDNWTLTSYEKRPRYNAKWIQDLEVDTTDPTTNGDLMMWHAATSKVKWVRGLTTRGDILYGDSSANYGRLPVGTSRHVISSDGTDPSYKLPLDGIDVEALTLKTSGSSISVPASKKWMYVMLIAGGGGGTGSSDTYTTRYVSSTYLGTNDTALDILTTFATKSAGRHGGVVIAIIDIAANSGGTVSCSIGSGGSTGGGSGGDTYVDTGTLRLIAAGGTYTGTTANNNSYTTSGSAFRRGVVLIDYVDNGKDVYVVEGGGSNGRISFSSPERRVPFGSGMNGGTGIDYGKGGSSTPDAGGAGAIYYAFY